MIRFTLPPDLGRGDGLLTVLVNDGGVVESIQKRIPLTPNQLDVRFFPEGGDLVQGLRSRVYFSVRTPLGKEADIEARVVDEGGKVLSEVSTFYGGMGRFELTPEAGKSYYLQVTKPSNIEQRSALPTALASGCVMLSEDDFSSKKSVVEVTLACTEQRTVFVGASLRGTLVATVETKVGPEGGGVGMSMSPQELGALRLTLFDAQYLPMAERVVYRGLSSKLELTMEPDKASYSPRETVTLTLTAKGPDGKPLEGDFALAVVDDTILNFADDKTANILAGLLLLPEMPGQRIEEPNFYFSDDERAPRAMDLLLGTAGWRRFAQVPR